LGKSCRLRSACIRYIKVSHRNRRKAGPGLYFAKMLNFLISPFLLLSLLPLCSAVPQRGRQRCTAVDTCWPSVDIWNEFNSSIAGRLIATRPSAAVCHAEDYDEVACLTAKQNWTVSDWRTEQPGAYTGMLWEYGPVAQCFINTIREAACQQGYVPRYSVNASSIEDIQQAIHFADEHDLLLAIKNTGHDHLGRSSGGMGSASGRTILRAWNGTTTSCLRTDQAMRKATQR